MSRLRSARWRRAATVMPAVPPPTIRIWWCTTTLLCGLAEIARRMALGKAFGFGPPDPVHALAALHRGARLDLRRPAQHVRVGLRFEELLGAVQVVDHEPAVPRK